MNATITHAYARKRQESQKPYVGVALSLESGESTTIHMDMNPTVSEGKTTSSLAVTKDTLRHIGWDGSSALSTLVGKPVEVLPTEDPDPKHDQWRIVTAVPTDGAVEALLR